MERLMLLEQTTPYDSIDGTSCASGGGRPEGVDGRGSVAILKIRSYNKDKVSNNSDVSFKQLYGFETCFGVWGGNGCNPTGSGAAVVALLASDIRSIESISGRWRWLARRDGQIARGDARGARSEEGSDDTAQNAKRQGHKIRLLPSSSLWNHHHGNSCS
jgi:hypothetical protein